MTPAIAPILGGLLIAIASTAALTSAPLTSPAHAESGPDGMPGEKVFRTICQGCHLESLESRELKEQEATLPAAPMDLLSTLLRQQQGNDRDAFIGHVVDFVRTPSPEKSLLPRQAIAEHGVMPPVSQYAPSVTYEELTSVAGWIFDHYDFRQERREVREALGKQKWPAPAPAGAAPAGTAPSPETQTPVPAQTETPAGNAAAPEQSPTLGKSGW